uniref:Uncharacterized protein n=1 Tax=Populus trichocarpa TaxID=3694 RepID=A9PDT5_POPTR|nr:unknown [Populus trichocarpa]
MASSINYPKVTGFPTTQSQHFHLPCINIYDFLFSLSNLCLCTLLWYVKLIHCYHLLVYQV